MNRVLLVGTLSEVRERWLPSGEAAVIAALVTPRPDIGNARASVERWQPLPLRATGAQARQIASHEGETVEIRGYLRRRYYRRDGEPHWGQVEIWVEQCQPLPSKTTHFTEQGENA